MFLFFLCCYMSTDVSETERTQVEWVNVGYEQRVNKLSNSSVRIEIHDAEEKLGHGSGNYFHHKGFHFILTAAHVVDTENSIFIVEDKHKISAKIIFIDFENDVAVLVAAGDIHFAEAARWKLNKDEKLVGARVMYSGFPMEYGKVFINGMVSAVRDKGLVIQSFALPGSSGSTVFDDSGRILGVVSSVGVHASPFSPYPVLQEDIVFVSKINISNKQLMEVLRCGS